MLNVLPLIIPRLYQILLLGSNLLRLQWGFVDLNQDKNYGTKLIMRVIFRAHIWRKTFKTVLLTIDGSLSRISKRLFIDIKHK
jgi:hypothetical protein